MDDQYWDALTSRIQSAESFLRKSHTSHSPSLIERDISTAPERVSLVEDDRSRAAVDNDSVRTGFYGSRSPQTTLQLLNNTIEDGRIAFKDLIYLTKISCFIGLSLMVLAAISGIFLQRDSLTLIVGVLGISILIAMLVMNPKGEIQIALTNLIQAQTVSADFYNQLQFWTLHAHESASTEERQQASQALHDATTFALKALHEYVEPLGAGKKR
jgi:hypothetical protein